MRDRYPEDWRVDLRDRSALEMAVERAIDEHPDLTRLATSTNSFDRLDFQVLAPGERLCELELKAKRQPYRGWPALRPGFPERDLFILDELALRRIVDAGRYTFLLVRDVPCQRWCLWGMAELVLTTKVRVSRRLATGSGAVKGKLLIDLGSAAAELATAREALDEVCARSSAIDRQWTDVRPWPWAERLPNAAPARGA